jgi:hypothetical protein
MYNLDKINSILFPESEAELDADGQPLPMPKIVDIFPGERECSSEKIAAEISKALKSIQAGEGRDIDLSF